MSIAPSLIPISGRSAKGLLSRMGPDDEATLDPAIVERFGAGGALAWPQRVLAPFNRFVNKHLPPQFAILELEIKHPSDAERRQPFRGGVLCLARRKTATADAWRSVAARITAFQGDFGDAAASAKLTDRPAIQRGKP